MKCLTCSCENPEGAANCARCGHVIGRPGSDTRTLVIGLAAGIITAGLLYLVTSAANGGGESPPDKRVTQGKLIEDGSPEMAAIRARFGEDAFKAPITRRIATK